jgi:hypothetical protein
VANQRVGAEPHLALALLLAGADGVPEDPTLGDVLAVSFGGARGDLKVEAVAVTIKTGVRVLGDERL